VTVAFRRVETPEGQVREELLDAGRNPPEGVIIHYWLRDRVDSLSLSILDAAGNEVRKYTSKRVKGDSSENPTEGEVQQVTAEEEVASEDEEEGAGPWAPNAPGMNRLVWDYRYEKPVKIESGSRGSREEALEGVGGPRALPGGYQVQLKVGDQVLTEQFQLVPDPRLPVTAEELRKQFDLKMAIRERTSETNTAVNQIRRLRRQIEDWEKRKESLREPARALKERLRAIEAELINVDFEKPRPGPNRIKEKLDSLSSMIDESDDAPTRGAFEVYDMLRGQLETQVSALRGVIDGPVAEFNALIAREGLQPVGV
jgi:FtsZ-binding cell division protein ZapB